MDTPARIAAGLATGFVVLVGTTGCGFGGNDGTAVAAGTIDFSEFRKITFDPCNDIPEQVFRDFGLAPEEASYSTSVDADAAGIHCDLRTSIQDSSSRRTLVRMSASTTPYDDTSTARSSRATRIDVNGRAALVTDFSLDDSYYCDIVMSVAFGSVVLELSEHGSGATQKQTCDSVQDFAETIEQYLDT